MMRRSSQVGVLSLERRLFLLYQHPVFDTDERADIAALASVSALQAWNDEEIRNQSKQIAFSAHHRENQS